MPKLLIVLVTGILCILLGVGVMAGVIWAYPQTANVIDSIEKDTKETLERTDEVLSQLQEIIPPIQNRLDQALEAIDEAQSRVESAGTTLKDMAPPFRSVAAGFKGVGDAISKVGCVLGACPFAPVGSILSGMGAPIDAIAVDIETAGNDIVGFSDEFAKVKDPISNINQQLDKGKEFLSELQSRVGTTLENLPSIFNQIRFALLLVALGFVGFASMLILTGLSFITIRRAILKK